MQNLKINGTPTPYWCVVVDKWNSLIYDGNSYQLLGCITLSEMDEEVREVVNYCNDFTGQPVHEAFYEGAMAAILTHNQITLTTSTKAVVVKQIN